MNHEQIHKIVAHKTSKIAKLGDKITPGFDPEDIHKFRVAVKKLRSFMRLINFDETQPKLKLPKKFKHLYDIAGIIRDAQLQLQQIATWNYDLPAYRQHLVTTINTSTKEWNDHYATSITDKLQEKLTDNDFKQLHKKALSDFFNQWMAQIHQLFDKTPDDNDIHSIRKHIKDMLYNTKLAEKKWPKAYEKLKPFPLHALDTLSDLIGIYNDERLMREQMETFNYAELAQEEQEALIAITKDGNKLLQQKRKKLLAEIRKFITAAPTL